jgi:DNA polymerase elongation subunit (family B)
MYRNVCTYTKGGKQVIWECTFDEHGNRIELESEIKPYLYYEDVNFKDATQKSMNNKPLRYIEFSNNFERSEWIKTSQNTPLFEKLSPIKQYLLNKYYGMERSEEFIKDKLRTFFLDIEVEIDGKFPEPELAEYPMNVISIYDTQTHTIYAWTYKSDVFTQLTDERIDEIQKEVNDEYEKDVKVEIYRFDREYDLILDFLKFWEANFPDIVTGWNIDNFDIKYIINRIMRIMPEGTERRLSPVSWHKNAISIKKGQVNKQITVSYHIMGVSICDYINLYKKFIPKSQQSFKLDYIAKMETGKGKLDYYDLGYDNMEDFMRKDFATFVKYNIIDSDLVKLIDDERHFIELMRRICNMGLCEYEEIFKSIPYVLGSLVIEARNQGVLFLTDANRSEDKKFESEGFEGAFVFPTEAGYYKNGIASFDFNSLYPNVIMSVNISPETLVGKVISEVGEKTSDVLIRRANGAVIKLTTEQFEKLLNEKCSIAANKALFIKPSVKFGIIPSFLDGLYTSRVKMKKECKKNLQRAKELDEEIKKLEEELKHM